MSLLDLRNRQFEPGSELPGGWTTSEYQVRERTSGQAKTVRGGQLAKGHSVKFNRRPTASGLVALTT